MIFQGLQSRSIFDVDQREKERRTFRAFWARLKREFSSFTETFIIVIIIGLFTYGLTLFLKTKYFSGVKHSELWREWIPFTLGVTWRKLLLTFSFLILRHAILSEYSLFSEIRMRTSNCIFWKFTEKGKNNQYAAERRPEGSAADGGQTQASRTEVQLISSAPSLLSHSYSLHYWAIFGYNWVERSWSI